MGHELIEATHVENWRFSTGHHLWPRKQKMTAPAAQIPFLKGLPESPGKTLKIFSVKLLKSGVLATFPFPKALVSPTPSSL